MNQEEISAKAKELVDRFNNCNKATGSFITEFQAKQHALITCDEIIKSGKNVDEFSDSYWQEVKKAIENL